MYNVFTVFVIRDFRSVGVINIDHLFMYIYTPRYLKFYNQLNCFLHFRPNYVYKKCVLDKRAKLIYTILIFFRSCSASLKNAFEQLLSVNNM